MRIVDWLFVVGVALFVGGIGFVVTGARARQQAAPVEAPVTRPVASIKQIMDGIVAPAATVIFGAVGTHVTAKGTEEIAPKNDAEWAKVGNSAAALIEAGNLLLLGDRVVDRGDWIKMAHAMMDAGAVTLKAVEAKSADGVLNSGEGVNTSCDTCHERYQRQ